MDRGDAAAPRRQGPAAPGWRLHAQLATGLDLQQDSCVDAVLVWDLLTRNARFGGPRAVDHWSVMIEFGLPRAPEALAAWASLPEAQPHQARLREALAPSIGRAPDSVIHTAVLADELLPVLLAGVRSGALLRFERGRPMPAPAPLDAPQCPAPWPAPAPPQVLHTLGVVASGCCLAHEALRTGDGGSRLLAVWDQTPDPLPRPDWQRLRQDGGPPPYEHGLELDWQALNALLQRHPRLGETQERALYAEIGRPHWGAARHVRGAGMLHLVGHSAQRSNHDSAQRSNHDSAQRSNQGGAQRSNQGGAQRSNQGGAQRSNRGGAQRSVGGDGGDGGDGGNGGNGGNGMPAAEHDAGQMPLLFVQLPDAGRAGMAPSAGQRAAFAPRASQLVDGARYIVERTRASAGPDGAWTTTLCLVAGDVAGPHDGSSMAEMALDQLAADARVRVVVAAGDTGQRAWHAHQTVHQTRPGQFWLRLPPGRRDDTLVQIWLPEGERAERFQLQVQAPGLPDSPLLRVGRAATLGGLDELPVAGVVWPNKPAQGQRGSLVLLALAPTEAAPGSARPLAPAGLWRFWLHAAGDTPAEVHAWLDCADPGPPDEPAPWPGAPAATAAPRFEPADDGQGARPSASHTWAGLANGQLCTVAMAYDERQRRVEPAASCGPRRGAAAQIGANPRQLCLAPVSRGAGLPGVAVPGFFSGQRATLRGSAAAAAQVARWLAEDRLTDDAGDWLRPAPGGPPLPEGARCLPPRDSPSDSPSDGTAADAVQTRR